ncbi:hypothetical protein ESZ36_00310 [Colwellia demingiae]|uniref:Tyr recombinase domain-containing protein n=1 Tax=Colwellia demingiae TaxID=89401 RepID=A0A5C6QRY9_9GAMM|nr:hypothetical protein [Colwellia demingiae]TWX71714.1 hypothetical protein ESZ36_00310 [Colwellia demingiae]
MRYIVKSIPHPQYNNQLIPILVDSEQFDLPLPSAALWGWHLWLSSKYNTCKARLEDLSVFYEYVDRHYPLFLDDAAQLKFLGQRQLTDLISTLLLNFKYDFEDAVKVKPSTFNRRIDSITSFLRFNYTRYIERLNDIDKINAYNKQLVRVLKLIKKKKFSKAEVENATRYTQPIDEDQINLIKDIIRPSDESIVNEINPFRPGLQVRNACIILLLFELGCRKSELVLIRNIDKQLKLTTNATIVIEHNDDAPSRNRKDGASHKTLNRELPISAGLKDLLIIYIEEYRPTLKKPQSFLVSDYLFLSEKDGGALTTSGVDYILDSLYKKVPELKDAIASHQLRVTRGIIIREAVDSEYENSNSPIIKSGDMQDTLTTWGGWSSTSPMPKRYTNSHIQKKIRDYLAGKEK